MTFVKTRRFARPMSKSQTKKFRRRLKLHNKKVGDYIPDNSSKSGKEIATSAYMESRNWK